MPSAPLWSGWDRDLEPQMHDWPEENGGMMLGATNQYMAIDICAMVIAHPNETVYCAPPWWDQHNNVHGRYGLRGSCGSILENPVNVFLWITSGFLDMWLAIAKGELPSYFFGNQIHKEWNKIKAWTLQTLRCLQLQLPTVGHDQSSPQPFPRCGSVEHPPAVFFSWISCFG